MKRNDKISIKKKRKTFGKYLSTLELGECFNRKM